LPINLVAEVNARGGTYFHLTLELPSDARGKELTAADMRTYGARLEGYAAQKQA
jgi:CRISPR-associated protein Csx16